MKTILKITLLTALFLAGMVFFTPRKEKLTILDSPQQEVIPSVPKPGDKVIWTTFPKQKEVRETGLTPFLLDIESHVSAKFGTQYRSKDRVTWSHESSHAIHAEIRNTLGKDGDQGLYVGNNQAVLIPGPKFKISQVAPLIPQELRGNRYQLYLIQQQSGWNDFPLYILDEWNAYINGAITGVEDIEAGHNLQGKNDYMVSILEFHVYSLYVLMACEKFDPHYDSTQLKEFTAWNLDRGMQYYYRGVKHDPYNWDDGKYLRKMQMNHELRQFVIKTYGINWAQKVPGFQAL